MALSKVSQETSLHFAPKAPNIDYPSSQTSRGNLFIHGIQDVTCRRFSATSPLYSMVEASSNVSVLSLCPSFLSRRRAEFLHRRLRHLRFVIESDGFSDAEQLRSVMRHRRWRGEKKKILPLENIFVRKKDEIISFKKKKLKIKKNRLKKDKFLLVH